jgi:adenosylhomocysteinase
LQVEYNPDHAKARAFFQRILSYTPTDMSVHLVVVAHLVDSAMPFIPALAERFKVQAIIPKPSSIQQVSQVYLQGRLPETQYNVTKHDLRSNPEHFVSLAFPKSSSSQSERVVILDIGGYFAPSIGDEASLARAKDTLAARGYDLVGIVEDTENGHQRYQNAMASLRELNLKVYSVARSPLKKPENHLVGVAVTFSIEAILRKSNVVLQSRRAGVIGFGPIGRSVAHSLRSRGIPVSICEIDPIKLAAAAAQGFRVFHYRHHFDDFVRGLNLVVSATGAGADENSGERPLDSRHTRMLERGTFVASVTSSDDEMDIESISTGGYSPTALSNNPDVERWEQADPNEPTPHFFYMMMKGNAVNFKHEGVVGPAIQLLQGEVIACVNKILGSVSQPSADVQELNRNDREIVANAWLDHYMTDSAVID